jgi:hypothetical protein
MRLARRQPYRYQAVVWLLTIVPWLYATIVPSACLAICVGVDYWLYRQPTTIPYYAERICAAGLANVLLGVVTIDIYWHCWRSSLQSPLGVLLPRDFSPELADRLETLCTELRLPNFASIVLDNDCEVCILPIPKWGVAGGTEYHLTLGLPLLQSIAPEELIAIITREAALFGKHPQQNNSPTTIYRLSRIYAGLQAAFDRPDDRRYPFLFTRDLWMWYIPRWYAWVFGICKIQETRADRFTADRFGVTDTGNALLAMAIRHAYCKIIFWPSILNLVNIDPCPPSNAFDRLEERLESEFDNDLQWDCLNLAVAHESSESRLRHRLSDRLFSLGYISHPEAPLAPPPMTVLTAARIYFGARDPRAGGERLSLLTMALNRCWYDMVLPGWQREHQQYRAKRHQLSALIAKAQDDGLTNSERWQQVELTAQLDGIEAALPKLYSLLDRDASHLRALVALSQVLATHGDNRSIGYIERGLAAALPVADELVICEELTAFFKAHGDNRSGKAYEERADVLKNRLQLLQEKRPHFAIPCEPVELPVEVAEAIHLILADIPEIFAAQLHLRTDTAPLPCRFVLWIRQREERRHNLLQWVDRFSRKQRQWQRRIATILATYSPNSTVQFVCINELLETTGFEYSVAKYPQYFSGDLLNSSTAIDDRL